MSNVTERLNEGDIPKAAALLADVFYDNPSYAFLHPTRASRRARLRRLFGHNLAIHLPHRCTYVSRDEHGDLAATLTVVPPGGVHVSLATMARRGLARFLAAEGLAGLRRFGYLRATYGALDDRAAGGEPRWYFHMMAVRPDLQGRGVGTRLARQCLRDVVDAEAPVGPEDQARAYDYRCTLSTQRAANLPFYARLGFEQVEESLAGDGFAAPWKTWTMCRPRRHRMGVVVEPSHIHGAP